MDAESRKKPHGPIGAALNSICTDYTLGIVKLLSVDSAGYTMKTLKQILLFARSLLDRILAKIDPPKPVYFQAFPEFTLTNYTASGNYNCSFSTDPNWNNSYVNCTVTNTEDTSSSGVTIYNE